MLRSELLKLRKGGFLLLVLAVMAAISFWASTREAGERYGLMTATQFIGYYESQRLSLQYSAMDTANYWNLDRREIEPRVNDLYDLAMETHGEQFNRLLNINLGTVFFSLFFAAYYIGMDFKSRQWNNALYIGHSRTSIFFSRITAYYVIVLIFSIVNSGGLIAMYSADIVSRIGAANVMNAVGRRLLTDWALCSLPLLWVYLFKGAVFPAIAAVVSNLGILAVSYSLWRPEAVRGILMTGTTVVPMASRHLPPSSLYHLPSAVPSAVIAACVVLGWLRFARCDLR
ncbi:MAG: hypothetical protein LBT88_01380 [Oscillospiraceae bacterium]|jgi:hypothetical protein|nr:hypothetical protein [Oscillospiraceae bacterium]